ncbi:hypothetical protein [Zooshikella harenae]|uniref:Uncharacterized protein n=1 Tax=Zooshikella harenae TaxID=2827238 RepID=A0ABS5ZE37_9GAMM|nr:hypothetical protein [Zooshikella harenae]MBU2711222.1 hypothetical protein [Zooshikella harenae]
MKTVTLTTKDSMITSDQGIFQGWTQFIDHLAINSPAGATLVDRLSGSHGFTMPLIHRHSWLVVTPRGERFVVKRPNEDN